MSEGMWAQDPFDMPMSINNTQPARLPTAKDRLAAMPQAPMTAPATATPAAAAPAASGWGANTDYASIVKNAYSQNGRVDPDQAGMDWWTQQLQSGKYANQQAFNTAFNASFAQAAPGQYIPLQAGAQAPGSQGTGNAMPEWMAGLQNVNLTPEQMAQMNNVMGNGGAYGTLNMNGYTFTPQWANDPGGGEGGSNSLQGYTAFKDGASMGDDDWYGQFGVDGTFQGARNPHEFDMGDATPFLFALAAGAAAMAPAAGAAGAAGAEGIGGAAGALGGAETAGYSAEMLAAMEEASAAFGGAGSAAGSQVAGIVQMGGAMDMATITQIGAANGLSGSALTTWAQQTGAGLGLGGTGPNFSQGFTDNGTAGGALDTEYAAGSAAGTGGGTVPGGGTNNSPPVNGGSSTPPAANNGTGTGTGTGTPTGVPGSTDWLKSLLGLVPGLAGLIGGLHDANAQGEASDKMLEWLKSRTAITDNLYAEGSPERLAMQQEMDRKDAAAGRNSQYGTRAVDLASNIAKIKASENTKMTTGIGQWMQGAYNQNASKYTGLSSALGNLDWTGIADLISNMTSSTPGNSNG